MRRLSLIAALCLGGCAHVACKPELVLNTWKPIDGFPDTEHGQLTVRQRLDEIESISVITCRYDD
jgi:hypothetical protein